LFNHALSFINLKTTVSYTSLTLKEKNKLRTTGNKELRSKQGSQRKGTGRR